MQGSFRPGRVFFSSLALVLVAASAAAEGEDSLSNEPAPEPGAIEFLVSQYGLTADEALAELQFQQQVECFLPTAVTALGNAYAGAVIGHAPASLTLYATGVPLSPDPRIEQELDSCGLIAAAAQQEFLQRLSRVRSYELADGELCLLGEDLRMCFELDRS